MFKGFYQSPFIGRSIAQAVIPITAQTSQTNPYLLENRGLTAEQSRAEDQRARLQSQGHQIAPLPTVPTTPQQTAQPVQQVIQQPQTVTPNADTAVKDQQPAKQSQTRRRAPRQQIPANPIYTVREIEDLYRGQSELSLRYALEQLEKQEESKDPEDQQNTETQIRAINNLLNEMIPSDQSSAQQQQRTESDVTEQARAVGVVQQPSEQQQQQQRDQPRPLTQFQQLKQEIIRNPPDIIASVNKAYEQYKQSQQEDDLRQIKKQLKQLDLDRLRELSKLDPHELESAIAVKKSSKE